MALLDFVWQDAGVLAGALIDLALIPSSLAFSLEFVATCTELCDSLLGKELLERPLLDILLFVLFQLSDELDGTLQDRALVLFAAWNNFGQLVDALVDGFASAAFNCSRLAMVNV